MLVIIVRALGYNVVERAWKEREVIRTLEVDDYGGN